MRLGQMSIVGIMSAALMQAPAQAKEPPKEFFAWVNCLEAGAQRFAKSSENAQVAANGVIGLCKDEENAVLKDRFKTPMGERMILGPRKLRADPIQQRQLEMVEEGRERVVAWIMEARASQEQ